LPASQTEASVDAQMQRFAALMVPKLSSYIPD
jgi:hypothetical protein